MKKVTIRVHEKQLDGVHALVEMGYYPNQSEAIRAAIGEMIREERRHNGTDLVNAIRKVRADGGER